MIMNFLSIDCSTNVGSLFVKVQNKAFIKVLQSDKSNYDSLMKNILDFFTENRLNFDDISKIFVNQGPGNYSGLRGSLSIAKGISLSKSLKLYGYDTFIWSSVKSFNKKNFIFSLTKIRDKYFVKKFDKKLNTLIKAKEISLKEIVNEYKDVFKVIPKNVAKYFDDKILKLNNISIEDLDHNELEMLYLNGLLNEDLIKPVYLS